MYRELPKITGDEDFSKLKSGKYALPFGEVYISHPHTPYERDFTFFTLKYDSIEEGLNFCQKKGIYNVRIEDKRITDCNFLKYNPYITGIMFDTHDLMHVDKQGLYYAGDQIEYISFDKINADIDFSLLSNVKEFVGEYTSKLVFKKSLDKLSRLRLWHYDGTACNRLPKADNLQSLWIVQSRIENLNHIDNFLRLKELCLAYDTRLSDLSALTNIHLYALDIETCNKLYSLDKTLGKLNTLREIRIISQKLELDDIQFVYALHNLFYLYLVVKNVKNGDLAPARRLPYFYTPRKKNYNDYFVNEYKQLESYCFGSSWYNNPIHYCPESLPHQ